MTLPVWPEGISPNSMSVNLVHNSKSFSSPYNGSTMSHKFPGARWVATLNFDALDNFGVKEVDILQSFIWSLEGEAGRFMMHNFSKPGSPEKGAPVVMGDNQYGGLLNTSGWTPNRLVVPRGHHFAVNNELKVATEDLYSADNGVCTMRFTPWLRTPPANGAAITTDKPKGMFRLVDDEQGYFDLTPGLEGTVSIQVVEVFNV
ncbi:hypothetical protein NVP2044O_19 [Vibrio phage 2.044.O._10N.261.51.B8]|nr:hypothetical protein NVP2044O_19 [Vibrio phage 2.044.O._10N.261.51.B8]